MVAVVGVGHVPRVRTPFFTVPVALVLAAVLGASTAASGCATNAEPLVGALDTPASEPAGEPIKLPPPSVASSTDGGTSPKPAVADAGKAAAPAPRLPGEPCAVLDEVFARACGACGSQSALCFSEDGGAGTVSEYSPCADEVAGGCIAGTVETLPCGNCGTQKRTCDATCTWSTSACVQPPGACKAGNVEYTVTGCPTPNTYRERSCDAACGWGAYTACNAPSNELVVDVPSVVQQTNAVAVILSAAQMAPGLPSGSCPVANLVAGDYPYAYVEVRNGTTMQAKVQVTTSQPGGGSYVSTYLAGYQIPFVPIGDDARKACTYPVSSSISNVVLEAGTSMLVHVRSYYKYSPTNPGQTTGQVNLNVRTTALL